MISCIFKMTQFNINDIDYTVVWNIFNHHSVHDTTSIDQMVSEVISVSDSLEKFYSNLIIFNMLERPREPTPDMYNLSFLTFETTYEVQSNSMFHRGFGHHGRIWCFLSNLDRFVTFDVESFSYFHRLRRIRNTHVLFEYLSNSTCRIHVLPIGFIYDMTTGRFRKYRSSYHIPFEFNFHHTLSCMNHNVRHSLLSKRRSCVRQILDQHEYPICMGMGSFYSTTGGDGIVLVSEHTDDVGHVLSRKEFENIMELRCSVLSISPKVDPCTILLPVMTGIPNDDRRPSYIITRDSTIMSTMNDDLFIVNESDLRNGYKLPVSHVLFIEDAQSFQDVVCLPDNRHIIFGVTDPSHTLYSVLETFGITKRIPFPVEELHRDLVVYQDVDNRSNPLTYLIEPEDHIKAVNHRLMHSHSHAKEYVLRTCAGAVFDRNVEEYIGGVVLSNVIGTETPFAMPDDVCMICLCIFTDPVMLSCRHVFCRHCIRDLLKCELVTCPACRTDICKTVTRPNWCTNIRSIECTRKQDVVTNHLKRYIEESTVKICIITFYRELGTVYRDYLDNLGISSYLYGFGTEDLTVTNDRVVICNGYYYNRAVCSQYDHNFVVDVTDDVVTMSRLLCTPLPTTVFLMRGCYDESFFKSLMCTK